MKTRSAALLLLFSFSAILLSPVSGQQTGLVLSGGGAKGVAHIGVIRALEENDIRIDYVAGTSIGAIIGSLYAMGYTTDEMLELIKSDQFLRWKTGRIESKYRFSYKEGESTPALLSVPVVTYRESARPQLPTYMVPSQVMDFAFMELTCGANAVCGGNFDSLMVPFRSVAADIYNKRAVVFRSGNLSHAVRSSMTYPIYFEPIVVDSMLLFDGGIYNNFPFDVLVEDFNPDFIIGSKVSNRSPRPTKEDMMSQLENMIMQPTNFTIPESQGLVIESNFEDVGLLDFEKADSLYLAGYRAALVMIPEIKRRAGTRTAKEMEALRKEFRESMPELKFRNINIKGVGPMQEEYIINLLSKEEEVFDMGQLREEYFRLISEENIMNAYPEARYNPDDGTFDLELDIRLKGSYNLSAGGLLSFTSYNQGFLEFDYFALSDIFNRFTMNMYLGRYYSSFKIAHRIAIPRKDIILVDLNITGNRYNYHTSDITSLFDEQVAPYIRRNESFIQAVAGRAITNNSTLRGGLTFTWVKDDYYQDRLFDNDTEPDNTQYITGSVKAIFESNTLNRLQFATAGTKTEAKLMFNTGYEYFESGRADTIEGPSDRGYGHSWFSLLLRNESYLRLNSYLVAGSLVDIALSNRQFSSNYTSTMVNSYRFRPTDFSNLLYGNSLRSNSYIAAGIKPLFTPGDNFAVRTGLYIFAPLHPTLNEGGIAVRGDLFSDLRIIGELGLVYHTPVGPLSAGVNLFSDEPRRAYYYLNFGYILFNRSGIE